LNLRCFDAVLGGRQIPSLKRWPASGSTPILSS